MCAAVQTEAAAAEPRSRTELVLRRGAPWVRARRGLGPYLLVAPAVIVLLTSGLVFIWAIPPVVAVDIWQWMFDFEFGVVNWALTALGAGHFIHHNWFALPLEGFTVITLLVVWGAIPFVSITLFAALAQIPRELVDSAQVDGANGWQVFWSVTTPILKPIFLILISLSIIWDFQVFTQIWVMLNSR